MKKNLRYILFMILTMAFTSNVEASTCYVCGDTVPIPSAIPNFSSKLITLAQISVPVILIVTGMIKYAKVVLSGEDKTAREVNNAFIKSLISAISVFLVVTIVKYVFTVVDKLNTGENKKSTSCINCFVNGNCSGPVTCPGRNTDMKKWKQSTKEALFHESYKLCENYNIQTDGCDGKTDTNGHKCKIVIVSGSPTCKIDCEHLSPQDCTTRNDCKPTENGQKCTNDPDYLKKSNNNSKTTGTCENFSYESCPQMDPLHNTCEKKIDNSGSKSCITACSNFTTVEKCFQHSKNCVWGTIDENGSQGCYEKK